MSRTSILYDTLDELEREFVSILLKELQRIASGHSSRFFSRKIAYLFEGKFWQDANTLRVEEIEKDIIALREKLAEPLDGGATGLAEEFAHRRAELPDRHKGGEIHLAKEMITKLTGAESGRGGRIPTPATPPTPPGMRVRTGRFQSDSGE